MMNGELAHTTAFADTSRPVSPRTFTDLQSILSNEYDNFLHQGAASYMTEFNTEYVDTLLYPEDRLQEEWNQGEVRRQQFSISIKLQHHLCLTFASINTLLKQLLLRFLTLLQIILKLSSK